MVWAGQYVDQAGDQSCECCNHKFNFPPGGEFALTRASKQRNLRAISVGPANASRHTSVGNFRADFATATLRDVKGVKHAKQTVSTTGKDLAT